MAQTDDDGLGHVDLVGKEEVAARPVPERALGGALIEHGMVRPVEEVRGASKVELELAFPERVIDAEIIPGRELDDLQAIQRAPLVIRGAITMRGGVGDVGEERDESRGGGVGCRRGVKRTREAQREAKPQKRNATPPDHSHSIVPGGLLVMSKTQRFTPFTSLMMREARRSRRS